jgi:beta-N-acetylhexosaminidase
MVMVSSAFYSRIDQDRPAAFSPVVIGQVIRTDLGFEGVVISDDLAAEAFSDVPPGQRVLRFLRAGGDLAIVGDGGLVDAMVSAVVTAAEDDPDVRSLVRRSASRVLTMKERRGLADCG